VSDLISPTQALLIFDLLIRIALSIRVITRRLDVGVSLAWIFVINAAPFVGAIFYLVIGERRLGRFRARSLRERRVQRKARLQSSGIEHKVDALAAHPGDPLSKLIVTEVDAPALLGNRWELLGDWESVFKQLIADIDAAKTSLAMEFYIWVDGGIADDVANAVERAQRRGVACRILVDDLGSRPFLRGSVARRLRESGVLVHKAMATGPLQGLFVRMDLRMHRKIVVIDDRIAYTGSLNLCDPRTFKQSVGVGQWVDAMVRLEGPVVEQLGIVFADDWTLETGTALEVKTPEGVRSHPDGAIMQVIPSGPDEVAMGMERILLQTLYAAQREIVLTTPYFVPDVPLLSAILSAAQRGVQVRLIVPRLVDSKLTHWASQAYQGDLAEYGVDVRLFEGGLLHTKSLTIDGEFSLFGSVNLDPRSLHLDFEITLAVYDRDFTQKLLALQQRYADHSSPLDLEAWKARGFGKRLLHDTARLVGPLL
jgi:cardiolipin synthase